MFDVPQWVQWLLFGLSATAIGLIFLLSSVAAARQTFQAQIPIRSLKRSYFSDSSW